MHVQAQREQPREMLTKGIPCLDPFPGSEAQWVSRLPRGSPRDPLNPVASPPAFFPRLTPSQPRPRRGSGY